MLPAIEKRNLMVACEGSRDQMAADKSSPAKNQYLHLIRMGDLSNNKGLISCILNEVLTESTIHEITRTNTKVVSVISCIFVDRSPRLLLKAVTR